MSAGEFEDTFYETARGNIANIRVQPETLVLVVDGSPNTAPAGPADQEGSVRVSGSRRTFGISARKVRLEWTGLVPDGYDPNGVVTVPILTPALYNSISRNQTGTYLGSAVRVLGKTPEYVN